MLSNLVEQLKLARSGSAEVDVDALIVWVTKGGLSTCAAPLEKELKLLRNTPTPKAKAKKGVMVIDNTSIYRQIMDVEWTFEVKGKFGQFDLPYIDHRIKPDVNEAMLNAVAQTCKLDRKGFRFAYRNDGGVLIPDYSPDTCVSAIEVHLVKFSVHILAPTGNITAAIVHYTCFDTVGDIVKAQGYGGLLLDGEVLPPTTLLYTTTPTYDFYRFLPYKDPNWAPFQP